jgi:hypothetical protein
MPAASVGQVWAYGTVRQAGCYFDPAKPCSIELIWHLGGSAGLDTTALPNASYQFCIQALQIEGHESHRCTQITIDN